MVKKLKTKNRDHKNNTHKGTGISESYISKEDRARVISVKNENK